MRDGGLYKLFSDRLSEAHWQAVETWAIGAGVPDANYCFPYGHEGWVEFKATATRKVVIRPAQIAWAERRVRKGGLVFLAVRQKRPQTARNSALDALFLFPGSAIRGVATNGLETPFLGAWQGGPGQWDWRKIQGFLCA